MRKRVVVAGFSAWLTFILNGCGYVSTVSPNQPDLAKVRKVKAVIDNMKRVEIAAQSYMVDNLKCPRSIDEMKSRLPSDFKNPITDRLEMPSMGNVSDLNERRASPPSKLSPGVVQYNVLPDGQTYAIVGFDSEGLAISMLEAREVDWAYGKNVIDVKTDAGAVTVHRMTTLADHPYAWSIVDQATKDKEKNQTFILTNGVFK